MPHSNRKRKVSQRPKRVEITGEDGWTRITSTGVVRPIAHLVPDSGHNESSDRAVWTKRLAEEAPPNVTIETLTQQYKRCEEKFLQSSCWKKLKEDLQLNAFHGELAIDTCICFGLGSPSAPRYQMDRRDVAIYQLACFLAMFDIIQKHQPRRKVRCFAQDPIFNSIDIKFLQSLSVTVLDDPIGFLQLSPASFAYAPGSEQDVTFRILHSDPAVFFGHELETYMGKDWRQMYLRFSAHTYEPRERSGVGDGIGQSHVEDASSHAREMEKRIEEYKRLNPSPGEEVSAELVQPIYSTDHANDNGSYVDESGDFLWINNQKMTTIQNISDEVAAVSKKDTQLQDMVEEQQSIGDKTRTYPSPNHLILIKSNNTEPTSISIECLAAPPLETTTVSSSLTEDDSNEEVQGGAGSGPPLEAKSTAEPAARSSQPVADMVAAYLKDKASIKMADFEEHSHAFYGNWIRYRIPKERTMDKVGQGRGGSGAENSFSVPRC